MAAPHVNSIKAMSKVTANIDLIPFRVAGVDESIDTEIIPLGIKSRLQGPMDGSRSIPLPVVQPRTTARTSRRFGRRL